MHGTGRVEHWTKEVVERETGLDEERKQGVRMPREADARNQQSKRDLKLSLRGSVLRSKLNIGWIEEPDLT